MKEKSVLAVCLSPTFQNTLLFDSFHENEVNRAVGQMEISASGKGLNVIRILGQLGRRSSCLVQLGGPREEEFLRLCAQSALDVRHVSCSAPIRTCTTVVNRAKGTSTELVENARPVDCDTGEKVRQAFENLIGDYDALVISGTKAPGFGPELFPGMVSSAVQKGILTVLDIKGEELRACLKFRPSIIKPNLSEFMATFFDGQIVMENEDSAALRPKVEKKAAQLFAEFGVRTIVSRGSSDTWAYDGCRLISVPNPPLTAPVVNTIGCGDTLTAALTHALLDGESFADSIAFGMKCAAQRATHLSHGL